MAKTYKNFFGKILYIIIIFIYFFLVTILSPFFIIIIFFIPELRRDILKRFFINKFKVKKEILVHASSAGEAILAYNLFKDNANYTYFNEGAYQIFKQKNINSLPLPFESIYTVFLFIFINRYSKLVIIEQEIWPAFLIINKLFKKKIILLNSNMYESSFRVQKKLKFLFSELFSLFDIILSKSNEDKKKLLCLNKNLKIENYGNFKILSTLKMLNLLEYDSISIQKSNEFKTILFSSFHPEEFSIAIEIIKLFQCNKNIKFILAPRHLDKLNILIAKLIENKITYSFFPEIDEIENKEYIRNDLNELLIIDFLIKKALSSNNIIIINKYGILSKIYSYSNLSIIGGSFNKKGGQNFIEALLQKSPVIIGPSYENFADLIEEFEGPWLHIIENFNNENELLNDLASKIKIILSNKEENIYDNLQTKIIHIKKIAEKQNEYILNLMK